METFQILSDQFNHFQHLFHRWLAIFFIISSYIFDLSSSPHTWGIRGRILSIVFLPVHPHLCWAYPSLHLAAISQNGSSPHTWGILPSVKSALMGIRFIPTYVGHTTSPTQGASLITVHPHIRGAYSRKLVGGIRVIRFIPTYVGHTGLALGGLALRPVHPHIRGAYGGGHERVFQPVRFIPTYVGHTRCEQHRYR